MHEEAIKVSKKWDSPQDWAGYNNSKIKKKENNYQQVSVNKITENKI